MKPNLRPMLTWFFLPSVVGMLCAAATPLCGQDYTSFFSGNGSFEVGSSSPPLSFPNSNSSVTSITGWVLSAAGAYPEWIDDSEAQDGNRYIKLTSAGPSNGTFNRAYIDGGSISHTPFTIGELYELSFWAAGGPAANNFVTVDLFPNQGAGFNLPNYTQGEFDALPGLEWSQYVVGFVATNPTMELSVSSLVSSQVGFSSIVYLDNFSISQVPEPGSAVLFAVGGLVLLAGRRRYRCTAFS